MGPFMELLQHADFWIGLIKIVWINIILSGDNAVVIALAARSLPAEQQKKAVLFGSGAAVVLRIVLTVVAAKMMQIPYLQIVGGLLLLWIGVQLLTDGDGDEHGTGAKGGMMAAIRTILIADLVMSLDNVIAVAAAAQGSMTLLILGLAISIPLVIFGSTLMIRLMERFPVIVTLGAALIGWVAGETIVSDTGLKATLEANTWLHWAAAAAGAVVVLSLGRLLKRPETTVVP
jgi:YjbE family integral membrane protein